MLPFIENQALYDQFDIEHGEGVWLSDAANVPNWRTPAKEQAIGTRPEFVYCPSSQTLPRHAEDHQTWSIIPATGSYAFCSGHRGPNRFQCHACMVKHHNSGMHKYWTRVKIKEVLDGMSKTLSIGETVEGHTRDSSNIWTYAFRYADSTRVTEAALNTPPGVEAVQVCEGGNELLNGAFASDHPGGAQFLFADGRVEFISEDIDLDTYQNLSTIAGTPVEMDRKDDAYCDQF
jgi:prepilin-type processing-associated H-X9-DG protein